jgi:hypothetical protein
MFKNKVLNAPKMFKVKNPNIFTTPKNNFIELTKHSTSFNKVSGTSDR